MVHNELSLLRISIKYEYIRWKHLFEFGNFLTEQLNKETNINSISSKQTLAGLVELPAIAIAMYVIMKTGKKWLFCGTLMTAGLACLGAATMEGNPDMLWLKITFVMIGMFFFSTLFI